MTKIPRFTFEKFSDTEEKLGTAMKSIGECMAIGRNFKESLQKAIRSLEIGLKGLDSNSQLQKLKLNFVKFVIPNLPNKFLIIAECIRRKVSIEKIVSKSGYDSWFVGEIREIINTESQIKNGISSEVYLKAKVRGILMKNP